MDILYNTNFDYAPATIESIGHQWTEDHPIVRPNGFPYLLYLKTQSGVGKVQIAKETFLLPKDHSVIISPHIPYCYESYSGGPWQTDFFSISGELVSTISTILEYNNYFYIQDDQNFDAQHFIKHWYGLLQNSDEPINYLQLSVDVLDFFVHLKTNLSVQKLINCYAYKKYVKPTLRFIKSNYSETIKISDLANMVNITPQYLSKLYQDYFDISCQQYLINYRITVAKNLLIQYPDLPITDIALECGFKTSSHFIEKFRKVTGLTPKKFKDFHYTQILESDS